MDTQQPQHDTDFPKTDPALDALLDEAVAAGTPPADAGLSDRIYRQTLPMLGQRPVLARIGPTLLRIAAAVAIIAGGLIAVTVMNQQPQAPDQPVVIEIETDNSANGTVEELAPALAAIDNAVEPGNTLIDEQLDVLALRVDMMSTEGAWGDDGLSASDQIDRAVARFEIDQFSDDVTLALVDEPMLY